MLFREFLEGCRAWSGDSLRQLKVLVVLALTEILRTEQLLGADDLRAVFDGAFGKSQCLFHVRRGIGRAGSLQQAEPDGLRTGNALHDGLDFSETRRLLCMM